MKIKIFGEKWKLEFQEIAEYGWCYFDEHKIVLNSAMSQREKMHKLFHEVLHIVTIRNNLPLSDCGTLDSNEKWIESDKQTLNHLQLDLIAKGLADFILDNPKLF